jgi:hypothetical protein
MNDEDDGCVGWICPLCLNVLAPSRVPQEAAFDHLRIHEAAHHPGLEPGVIMFRGTSNLAVTREGTVVPRLRAVQAIPERAKNSLTTTEVHSSPIETAPPELQVKGVAPLPLQMARPCTPPPVSLPVPVTRFPFEILPPGAWRLEDIIDYYKRASQNPRWEYAGKTVEWERLEQIQRLQPEQLHLGKDGWYGYVVFTFEWTRRVILECPIKPNAIYVINGPWDELGRHSKRELLTRYEDYVTRVPHIGDWFGKLDDALGYLNRPKHLRYLQG